MKLFQGYCIRCTYVSICLFLNCMYLHLWSFMVLWLWCIYSIAFNKNNIFHKELIAFKDKQYFPHFFQGISYSFDKRNTINTKEFHLEIWNYVLMFEEILHPFQRDDALSWRIIFQIVIHVVNIHFKEKNTLIYIYTSLYILIWNGVGIC